MSRATWSAPSSCNRLSFSCRYSFCSRSRDSIVCGVGQISRSTLGWRDRASRRKSRSCSDSRALRLHRGDGDRLIPLAGEHHNRCVQPQIVEQLETHWSPECCSPGECSRARAATSRIAWSRVFGLDQAIPAPMPAVPTGDRTGRRQPSKFGVVCVGPDSSIIHVLEEIGRTARTSEPSERLSRNSLLRPI